MASTASLTSTWIKFFTDAGIPSGIAASYALTFSNNRIRMDMLLDLNKEYLKDMGITLMGDVISILRHAKHVHEQTAREKILASSASASPPRNQSRKLVSPPQKPTPAFRMLDHYMRKTDSSSCNDDDESDIHHELPTEKPKTEVHTTSVQKVKKVLKAKSEDVVVIQPQKKARRVLPEHEGRYKITMPSGSTPKTQKILAKQGILSQKKKTVFDRLGDGSVTSTTENEGPSITITGLGTAIVKPAHLTPEKQSSVFSRLGEKSQVTSTSSQDLSDDEDFTEEIPVSMECELPYAGVLKQEPRKKILKKVATQKVKVPTMQADIESARQLITEDGRVMCKAVQVQERLGAVADSRNLLHTPKTSNSVKTVGKVIKPNKTTAGILANPTNARKLSVKARLGSSDSEASPSTTTPNIKRKKIIFVKRVAQKVANFRDSQVNLNTVPVKSVTFGGVTEKNICAKRSHYK